ncbi:ribosome maturation factor RimM [Bifidobacterium sp. B4001]|uniref:ribosome maturation factor RimM n=1 Tax=unclassified Bifidobacterium TaxID=2608897 RepID=UPI00226B1147|nr:MULTISPECIES: ribosome maturation factor RimM [unclassified Bifidobacterium]MCX8673422.1 ribosome maturation factor RimM [Bifidobacterium sp. B4079]MCX8681856.1 ribosome maturation factor RimM [Bifidobacterium sp. B4001]
MSPSRSANHDPQGPDPQQRRLLRVCRIGRAQGLKGEVNVYVCTDEPERRFAPGSQLQTRDGQVFTVVSSRRFKQRWIVLFQGVEDRNASEALNGIELYTHADPAEELAQEDAWYSDDLIGLEVRMAPGNSLGEPSGRVVGQVSDVLDGVAQQQLQIRMTVEEGDEETEGLIPFVEALVPQVDIENGYVAIDPPGGLLPGLG